MRRIYYGWVIVALAVAIDMIVVGMTYGAFGIFVHPVSKEFGLSRAEMNTALILMNLGNAAVAPILGRMLDRFPVRPVFMVCAIALGAALVILGLSRSLWLNSALLAVALPLGYLGAGTLTLSVLIARWFKAQRGRAMALTGVGMSLGAATMTPVVGLLVEHLGWRSALLAMGAGVGALLVALAFLLRDGPGPDEIETRQAPRVTVSAEPSAAALNFGSILRSPQFWSIGVSCAAAFAVNQTVSITLVPLGQEGGLTTIEAATLMSFLGVGAVAGSLLLALIADRLDRVVLLTTVLLLGAVLNAAVPHAHGYVPLAAISGLIGVTSAALPPTLFALLADRFGPASFGAVRGMTMPLNAVLGMIAVRFAGEAFDRTGGYQLTFETFAILQVAAAALMFASRYLGSASARPAPAPTVS